jgi:hypothetical protein
LASVDKDVTEGMIQANSAAITEALQKPEIIDCEHLPLFFDAVDEINSSLTTDLVCHVDPIEARKHWMSLLAQKPAKAKRAMARVIGLAKGCSGEIGSLARTLEAKVPKRYRMNKGS